MTTPTRPKLFSRGEWPEAQRIAALLRLETVGGALLLIAIIVVAGVPPYVPSATVNPAGFLTSTSSRLRPSPRSTTSPRPNGGATAASALAVTTGSNASPSTTLAVVTAAVALIIAASPRWRSSTGPTCGPAPNSTRNACEFSPSGCSSPSAGVVGGGSASSPRRSSQWSSRRACWFSPVIGSAPGPGRPSVRCGAARPRRPAGSRRRPPGRSRRGCP